MIPQKEEFRNRKENVFIARILWFLFKVKVATLENIIIFYIMSLTIFVNLYLDTE